MALLRRPDILRVDYQAQEHLRSRGTDLQLLRPPLKQVPPHLVRCLHFHTSSYGFCIGKNQYDSAQARIWRKVEKQDKTEERLARALLVTEEQYLESYEELESLTKVIRFKMNRLNPGKSSDH